MSSLIFGDPADWEAFATRNARFIERYQALEATMDRLTQTKPALSSDLDTVIFLMARFAVDDFMEIVLVCGNAESFAAEKLLRSMYERVWTLLYLRQYPAELDRYVDWGNIAQFKFMNAMPADWRNEATSPERAKRIEASRKEAKERFGFKECEACGAQNPLSWSSKNPVSSAKELGLEELVFTSYYVPLDHTHPNISGLLQRVKVANETVEVQDRHDVERCDRVLMSAHLLLIKAVHACVGQFELDEGAFVHLSADYEYAWEDSPAGAVDDHSGPQTTGTS